jgi:hypothetical protein
MNTTMIVLLQLNFTGFFVQTITGFAGALIVYFLLFVMPLPDAIGYLSIFI